MRTVRGLPTLLPPEPPRTRWRGHARCPPQTRLIFQMTLLSSSGPTFLTKALPEMTDCELSSAQQESASVKASAVPDSKGLGDAGPGVAEGTGPFGWDPGSPHEACQAPASGSLTGKRACSPPTVYTWAAPSLIM